MTVFLRQLRLIRPLFGQMRHSCLGLRSLTSNTSVTGLSMIYEGDIAVIKMEKDDNRLNPTFFDIFHDFLDQVEGNDGIKGLITTGHGKFYSNGLDLNRMAGMSDEELADFIKSFIHFLKRMLLFPVPNVAAVNGHAFAGGALMALTHDFRVMNQEKGWLCINEVHLSIRGYDFITSLVRSKIGSGQNLNDAYVFGSRYTAEEALSNKIIHSHASSSSEIVENSLRLLRSYIGKDGMKREAIRQMKEDVYKECLAAFDKQIEIRHFWEQFKIDSQSKQR